MPEGKTDLPVATLAEAAPYLRRPFTAEAIKFRPVGGGLVVAYLDARLVGERLNMVIPDKWETRFEPYPGGKQIICHLTVDGVTRSDVGTQGGGSNIDPVKVGFSDAFKRAGVHFGIGVSVYALRRKYISDLPANGTKKVPSKSGKDSVVITPEGETWLRRGYRKWLTGEGRDPNPFGEALSHGDEEGSVGDPEATPPTPGGEPVEQPSEETVAAVKALEDLYEEKAPPGSDARKKFGLGKFKAQLKAAAGDPAELAKLREKVAAL